MSVDKKKNLKSLFNSFLKSVEDEEASKMQKEESIDKFINLSERFDQHKLNYIIENWSDYKTQMRKKVFKDKNYNPLLIAKDYLSKSKYGIIDVLYKQNKGYGRFNAVRSRSLQSMAREIRHSIALGLYIDIDIVNCHPVILEWLCIKNKYPHKYLSRYVLNREEIFKQHKGDTRDVIKSAYLSLTNGGTKSYNKLKTKTRFGNKYKDELIKIHACFSRENKEEFDARKKLRIEAGKDRNHEASFMNTILCDWENKILQQMHIFYNKCDNAVLCFDGIMVPFKEGKDYEIKKCMKYIKDTLDIDIDLKIKPMTEGFTFPDKIDSYDNASEDDIKKYKIVRKKIKQCIKEDDITDRSLSDIFYEMEKDNLVIINDNGDGYVWTNKTRLWEQTTYGELMLKISGKDSLILKAIKELMNISTTKIKLLYTSKSKKNSKTSKEITKQQNIYDQCKNIRSIIKSARGVKNIYTFAKYRFLNENFINEINRKHDLLPVRGGLVIDLKTGKTRDRTKTDMFSLECPVSYHTEKSWTKEDKATLYKFVNQIYMDDPEYIRYKQIKMGSYLSGRCVRDIDIDHGDGRNGKSSIIKALAIVLGEFTGFIGKGVIVFDPKAHRSKNQGGHTSHLIPIDGKRLIITQELEDNDTLDSEMIKKIASADEIEGVRECYGRKTRTIKPFCKLIVSTNVIPKFDVQDRAIIDRLCFNPHTSRFLNKEGLKLEKSTGIYDESKISYYEADDSLIEKYAQVGHEIDIFFSWLVVGCIEFYKVRQDGIKKPKIVTAYIQSKIDDNDVVGSFISECCNIVDTKTWSIMDKQQKILNTITSIDLYESFSSWATRNNCHQGIGKLKFNKNLCDRLPRRRTKRGYVFDRISFIMIDSFEENSDNDL